MNMITLKQAGDKVFTSAVLALGNVDKTRGQARAAVLAAIASHGLQGSEASFAGSFAMAQFGFGGGL